MHDCDRYWDQAARQMTGAVMFAIALWGGLAQCLDAACGLLVSPTRHGVSVRFANADFLTTGERRKRGLGSDVLVRSTRGSGGISSHSSG